MFRLTSSSSKVHGENYTCVTPYLAFASFAFTSQCDFLYWIIFCPIYTVPYVYVFNDVQVRKQRQQYKS